MWSTRFLGKWKHHSIPRRYYSFKHLHIAFMCHVLHMSNWDHFTQDVLIAFQRSTLWCEHHSATSVPLQSASFLPSVLILSAVLTNAKRVALNMTVPSLFSGIFMETRRCGVRRKTTMILPTHGLKRALPCALMMPSRPAIPLMWTSIACGFIYTIINKCLSYPLMVLTMMCLPWGLSHIAIIDTVFYSMGLSLSNLCVAQRPVGICPQCITWTEIFSSPQNIWLLNDTFYSYQEQTDFFMHHKAPANSPALKVCQVQMYIESQSLSLGDKLGERGLAEPENWSALSSCSPSPF